MKKTKFTKYSSLTEILETDKRYMDILMGFGLHCFSCPLTNIETVEDVAAVHGIDLDFLLQKLNENFDE